MSSIFKNGLMLLGLVMVAGLGYYFYTLQSEENTQLSGNEDISDARLASERFLRELNTLQNFELSDELFRDPRFRSFVDFSTPVPEQPLGRENPFAPVP